MRKICVVTGARSEYGLLRWVIEAIKEDPDLTLQIIATGMHLSPEFGSTYREIEQDGFKIDRKVEMLLSSDTKVGIAKSMGLGLIGFADALHELQPDLLVVLGDRFEIFSAVSAALSACIPVAHIHGGETTEGAIDEAFRHAITKMAHLHFVAAPEYYQRVIQLGEQPDRVFLVGGLGVDSIRRLQLLDKRAVQTALNFELGQKSLLITFHPETIGASLAERQMAELLAALAPLKDTQLIFTLPNADADGRVVISMIQNFVAQNPNARSYTNLGQLLYLSCAAHVDAVIGNSSSGLTEVPSLKKGTVNIGHRQRGRLQAKSIVNCEATQSSITSALMHVYSTQFQEALQDIINPYGEGGASHQIVSIIKTTRLEGIQKKSFYDLPDGNTD